MAKRIKTLTIQTPEGVSFSLVIASPITRFLALLIDKACIMVVTNVTFVLFKLFGLISADLAMALFMISLFLVSTFYPIIMEWFWRGQTIGKKLLRLQVVDVEGLRMKFSQIVVRNILRAVDALPQLYLVGATSAFFSARGQRLGDIAANTIVIQHTEILEPDFDQGIGGKYNSFKEYPHIAARLRQNITPDEAGIAVQALARRDTLEDEARLDIFAALRRHFEKAAKFPDEVTEGISDEQYIRNTLAILFS